jgi:hypothetical protein
MYLTFWPLGLDACKRCRRLHGYEHVHVKFMCTDLLFNFVCSFFCLIEVVRLLLLLCVLLFIILALTSETDSVRCLKVSSFPSRRIPYGPSESMVNSLSPPISHISGE